MEATGEFSRRIEELKSKLRRQMAAAEELGPVLDRCANGVAQHDQAVSLDSLKVRIVREVDDARIREIVASNEFNKRKLTKGAVSFATGALFAAIAGQKDALSRGARLIQPVLAQKAPFGTVLVVVGKEGLPHDVAVVSLSQLARESGKEEQQVRDNLEKSGHFLIEPDKFALLINNLKRKVLRLSVSFPITIQTIDKELNSALPAPNQVLKVTKIP
jgi:hypothetical protein